MLQMFSISNRCF